MSVAACFSVAISLRHGEHFVFACAFAQETKRRHKRQDAELEGRTHWAGDDVVVSSIGISVSSGHGAAKESQASVLRRVLFILNTPKQITEQ